VNAEPAKLIGSEILLQIVESLRCLHAAIGRAASGI